MTTLPEINNSGVRSELNLQESLIIESIKHLGIDVYYIPRDRVVIDDILQETIISDFRHAHLIEMRVENVEGYAPVSVFMSELGLSISDNITVSFAVSRSRFRNEIPNETDNQPKEGALIYEPASKQMFEIKSVDAPNPMIDRAGAFVFILQTELYKYSHEDMEDIDIPNDSNLPIDLLNPTEIDIDIDDDDIPDNKNGSNWELANEIDDITINPRK